MNLLPVDQQGSGGSVAYRCSLKQPKRGTEAVHLEFKLVVVSTLSGVFDTLTSAHVRSEEVLLGTCEVSRGHFCSQT